MTFQTTFLLAIDILLVFALVVMIIAKPGPIKEKR